MQPLSFLNKKISICLHRRKEQWMTAIIQSSQGAVGLETSRIGDESDFWLHDQRWSRIEEDTIAVVLKGTDFRPWVLCMGIAPNCYILLYRLSDIRNRSQLFKNRAIVGYFGSEPLSRVDLQKKQAYVGAALLLDRQSISELDWTFHVKLIFKAPCVKYKLFDAVHAVVGKGWSGAFCAIVSRWHMSLRSYLSWSSAKMTLWWWGPQSSSIAWWSRCAGLTTRLNSFAGVFFYGRSSSQWRRYPRFSFTGAVRPIEEVRKTRWLTLTWGTILQDTDTLQTRHATFPWK